MALKLENTNKSADKHLIFFTPAVPTVYDEVYKPKGNRLYFARQEQRRRSALRLLRNVQAEHKPFAQIPVIFRIKQKLSLVQNGTVRLAEFTYYPRFIIGEVRS